MKLTTSTKTVGVLVVLLCVQVFLCPVLVKAGAPDVNPESAFTLADFHSLESGATKVYASPANQADLVLGSSGVSSAPIDVWYGSRQVFGRLGNPQEWVNILGNVSDPDTIASLTYSLNGGLQNLLSIGPGPSRLVSAGDFNVEMAYTDLVSGSNQIAIVATDDLNNRTVETVTVEYAAGNVWPETYSVDWSSVTAISEVAQIVDGLWILDADSIRPAIVGYDRLVAIGDLSWDDYEVQVPITINEPPANPNKGGVGIVLRWRGHQGSTQPRTEWWHMGAYGYYRWRDYGPHLALRVDQNNPIENSSVQLDVGTRYNFKMRVRTAPVQGGVYGLKVWEDGWPEPGGWHLVAQDGPLDPASGSLLLVAHEVNASFGDVTVVPLADISPSLTVTMVGSGTVSTDPEQADYTYGQVVTLTAMPAPGWMFAGWGGGLSGNANPATLTIIDDQASITATFITSGTTFASDDFNTCGLDSELWDFIDPLEDATLTLTGTHSQDAWASISVPAGIQHTMSSSNRDAPRIMQPAYDTDFEIEVKFESAVAGTSQMQGILVEQEQDQRYLRFDFVGSGSDTRIFAAVFDDGVLTQRIDSVITSAGVAPLYMRVKREEDQWTQSYSFDGENWTTAGSFGHALTVNKVGAFVGNSGDNPAHTAVIDYFFNTASPVAPEDGDRNALTVDLVGDGTVAMVPDRQTYGCGQVVTLTATPGLGWSFGNWSGNLVGSTSPATLVMTGSRAVTATFVNRPPVLDTIGDQVVESGATLDFTVRASDPEDITPSLSAETLPQDATFTDNGDGTASFGWQPTPADEGIHTATFVAFDGISMDSETVTITVNAPSFQWTFLPFIVRGH